MAQSTFKAHRLRLASIMAVIFALLVTIFGWYIFQQVQINNERFLGQSRGYGLAARQQIDSVMVRIKDAAAFLLAGKAGQIEDKLRVASRMSPYLTELGYFYISGPDDASQITASKPVLLFGAQNVFSLRNGEELLRLRTRMNEHVGLATSLSPTTWRSIIPNLRPEKIVIAQAMPAPDGRELVVYASVDVKGVAQAATAGLENVQLVRLRMMPDDADVTFDFPSAPNWAERLLIRETRNENVSVTRNLKLTVTLREQIAGLTSLVFVMGGIVLTAVVGLALVLVFGRMQRQAQQTLETTLKRAEAASEAKSVFLANMSHEIRTPLNGVLGMAELLTRTNLTEDQRRYAEQIKSSGSTLLAILNDILDISKLESGQLAIDPVITDLPHLITDVARFYSASAQHKGLSLLLDLDPKLPEQVEVDPTRLRQVLGNLISNALKFTKAGEVVVTVTIQRHDEETGLALVDFAIRDTGIGISDENIAKLFSRFAQAEQSTTRIYGGTGLGLNICKQICELMGGTIGVRSEEGKGSTFSFALPLKALDGPAAVSGAGCRVALISSAQSLNTIVTNALVRRGMDVSLFEARISAADALAVAQVGQPFDAILIDEGRSMQHAAPIRDQLRRHAALSEIPIVILGAQEVCDEYKNFDLVVVKPFNGRILLEQILRLSRRADVPDASEEPVLTAELASAAGPPYAGRRALLVDDNNVNLMFGNEILGDLGFEVTQANNGVRAIDAARKGNFDVIFMDCQMPVMDGYQATGKLRELMAQGDVRRTPIIALTANALKGDREKCLAAGMDSFLTKPLKIAELESTLHSIRELRAPRAPAGATPNSAPATIAAGHATPPPPPQTAAAVPLPATSKAPKVVVMPDKAVPSLDADPSAAANANPRPAQAQSSKGKVPLIDVAAFRETRGSMKNFNTLLDFYRTDTAQYLADIKSALAMGNIEDAVMPAHTIKSSSRIIGAVGLAVLAENFEKRARAGGAAQTKELNALRIHMDRIFALTLESVDKLMGAERSSDAA